MKTATITAAQLKAKKACKTGVKYFRAAFGGALTYTADDIPMIVEMHSAILGEYATWCAENMLTRSALEAYYAAKRPAWAEYNVIQRTALEEYEAIRRPALEAYYAAKRPARKEYYANKRPALEAYRAIKRPALGAYRAIERPALGAYRAKCSRAFLELYLEDRQ
jgi:hypothetical protein